MQSLLPARSMKDHHSEVRGREHSLHDKKTQVCCCLASCLHRTVKDMQCVRPTSLIRNKEALDAHLVMIRAVTPITANRKPPNASTTPIVIPMGKCVGAAVALLVGIPASASSSMSQQLRARLSLMQNGSCASQVVLERQI